jgi:hypothetical protein
MAAITGKFKSIADAEATITELGSSGISLETICQETEDGARLTVYTDADHAGLAIKIMSVRGSVDEHHHLTNWTGHEKSVPADEVSEDHRYVTENRDTSREPLQDRDDVQMVEEGVDRTPRIHKIPE